MYFMRQNICIDKREIESISYVVVIFSRGAVIKIEKCKNELSISNIPTYLLHNTYYNIHVTRRQYLRLFVFPDMKVHLA